MPNKLHVSALYLGHLQAYIRGGVHYTIAILIRDIVLRNIELRWCLRFTVRGDGILLLIGVYHGNPNCLELELLCK
jgi:hypothetical protein